MITFHLGISADRHDFGLPRSTFAATPPPPSRIQKRAQLFIFLLLLILPGCAFAQGTCPTAASYLNPSSGTQVTLASLGVTSCYYIAANGNDSASGTSESTPWLHAPGMANCSGKCATAKPASGEGFIFRGGDTWHFGNSSATPYVGRFSATSCGENLPCAVNWSWGGSSGKPIYIGVDPAWYSGSSWTRPVMNGDNPLSSTGVSSCVYDESNLSFFQEYYQYVIMDDFEFTGYCWSGAGAPGSYINLNTGIKNTYRIVENMAFHGWTHVTFSCSESGGEPVGNCDGGTAIQETANNALAVGDTITHVVCDGSDSDHESYTCIFGGGYDVNHSVFRYLADGMTGNNNHVFHDNLIDYLYHGSDGVSHTNGFEFNDESHQPNAIYNNVIRNLWPDGCAGEVAVWEQPYSTDYVFNNIQYNNPCGAGNYWNVANGNSGFTVNMFNNTFVISVDAPGIAGPPTGNTVNFINNHCITPDGGTASQCSSYQDTETYTGTINQSASAAASQGYTSSNAYQPTSGSGSTVGKGSNEQSICTTLTGSSDTLLQAAGTACQSDTSFACNYNSSIYTVTCPARTANARPTSSNWDLGAYQFQAGQRPLPPVGLAATSVQ